MLKEPRIVERTEQPYAAVKASAPMEDLADVIDKSFPDVYARLEGLGVEPVGPPFVRFNVIDMERLLEIEIGVPVAAAIPGDGHVVPGILPAGRYGSITHVGDYDGLIEANEALQQWAKVEGLEWAMLETDEGDRFESRLEVYLTDPGSEPDSGKETEVLYLLADA